MGTNDLIGIGSSVEFLKAMREVSEVRQGVRGKAE